MGTQLTNVSNANTVERNAPRSVASTKEAAPSMAQDSFSFSKVKTTIREDYQAVKTYASAKVEAFTAPIDQLGGLVSRLTGYFSNDAVGYLYPTFNTDDTDRNADKKAADEKLRARKLRERKTQEKVAEVRADEKVAVRRMAIAVA